MHEIIIIGSGIIGSFLAYDLSQYNVHVTILERNHDICEEISAANSAIIHAGYDPEEETLKGVLNKRGADLYPIVSQRLHVDYIRCGAMVLACGKEEEKALDTLYHRAKSRNIKVTYLHPSEIRRREPNVAKTVSKAMDVPDTAIITPWEFANALIDEAIVNGASLHLNEEVMNVELYDTHCMVTTNNQQYTCDMVINAAGLGAQRIMEMVEKHPLFHVTWKRGQYFVLSKQAKNFVHEVMYPVPTKVGKGVLAVPTVHGNTLLGPNSELDVHGDTSTTNSGLKEVKEKLCKTLDNVPYQEVIHTYSGIRPTGNDNDFFIQYAKVSKRMVHCACIDSPGLASAPAISEYVLNEFIMPQINILRREILNPRISNIRMKDLSLSKKQELIKKQRAYAHIICRCEEISEQEVVECIHRPCGARSIKGVKKRVRPGMGKCQGGFCEIEVAKILARELNIPLEEVCYDDTAYYEQSKGVKL